jgi:hypothetical protein
VLFTEAWERVNRPEFGSGVVDDRVDGTGVLLGSARPPASLPKPAAASSSPGTKNSMGLVRIVPNSPTVVGPAHVTGGSFISKVMSSSSSTGSS